MGTSRINLKRVYLSSLMLAVGITSLVVGHNVLAAPPAQPSFFGAVYTSTFDGTVTNQNQYASKPEVYLNGGPQNLNANGLPDGVYYFQVTNPNGAVLLSTDDAVCRQAYVVGGRFGGILPRVSDPVPVNLPPGAPYTDRRPDACDPHMNGLLDPSNGSTPVQLIPFNDTPNNGGIYKVWLIRRATSTTISGRVITFANSNAKTDNFKVEQTICIPGTDPECPANVFLSGMKYYDANGNGIKDAGEVPVQGVRILVTLSSSPDPIVVETDADGLWTVGPVALGTDFRAEEILPETCAAGSYWVQTGPVADSNGFQGYEGTAAGEVTNLDFGDICFSPGTGGMTLGFWSNKNGLATMSSVIGVDTGVYPTAIPAYPETGPGLQGDLNFLSRLNLKGEAMDKKAVVTVDFNPTNHPAFNKWVLSANAYNMSYMLSGQLAATSLNVRHTKLADSTLVDARGVCNSAGDCLGIISIGQVRILADASLGGPGGNVTISGGTHRSSQELMKNFLDAVNNNLLSFANAGPCSVCYFDGP